MTRPSLLAPPLSHCFLSLYALSMCMTAQAESSLHLLADARSQSSTYENTMLGKHAGKLGEMSDQDDNTWLTFGVSPTLENDEWQLRLSALGDSLNDGGLDVTELFLAYRPTPASAWQSQLKTGFFFAPFSLENTERFWQSAYGLTPSAADTWFGEELRTLGGEYSIDYRGEINDNPWRVGFSAAIFQGNDAAGSLLAWRGFALHSRISRYRESIALANLPVFADSAAFPDQQNEVQPFKEIDHRAGGYVGLRATYARNTKVQLWTYDNRGEPTVLVDGQYAWRTKFSLLSVQHQFADDWQLLAQRMSGSTLMGANLTRVDLSFISDYLLISKSFAQHNVSFRADHFSVSDHDQTLLDNNEEIGHSFAIAWLMEINDNWRIGAEWLQLTSTRPARTYIGLPAQLDEHQLSLSLRWSY